MRNPLKSLVPVVGAALLVVVGVGSPVAAQGEGDAARGTVKIEETEFSDQENPNEVKVECGFTIEFFGMDRGEVPVTFTLQPPSGDRVIARATARVKAAQGNEFSGSLDVDLSDELAGVPPAGAEDYDYKVRVDAEVKSTEGNESITKSAMLFIICDTSAAGGAGSVPPVGGVAAGGGGTAGAAATLLPVTALVGGALLLGVAVSRRSRSHPGA